jgi:hypothetical protein
MPATYELITTTTAGSNVSSITISSIPATYTDLVIVGNYRVVNGGGVALCARFNSDSASNYEFMGYYSNGSSNAGNHAQPYTFSYVGIADNVNWTTSVIHVNNYATTGRFRTLLAHSGNYYFNSAYTGNWNNSTNAIDSVTFICDGGSQITSGAKFSIYGILKA